MLAHGCDNLGDAGVTPPLAFFSPHAFFFFFFTIKIYCWIVLLYSNLKLFSLIFTIAGIQGPHLSVDMIPSNSEG